MWRLLFVVVLRLERKILLLLQKNLKSNCKSMFTGTQSIFINGNKKKVYEVAQTYPSFVRFFLKGSRVLQETDNTMEVEVHAKWFGFYKTKWQGYGKKDPCNLIHFTQTQGLFKGLIALWRFEETSGGTHVTIETTFSKPDLTKYEI